MSYVIGKNPCKRCRKNGGDKSGDNFHYYGEGKGGYCHACGYTILSDDKKAELEDNEDEWEDVMASEPLTKEQLAQIKAQTGVTCKGYRGLKDSTVKKYFVRHDYDVETGEVAHQYYGVTKGYKPTGYKIRDCIDKDFRSTGETGKNCDLFGQVVHKNAVGKFVLLTSGELDCLSAYQILDDYNQQRGGEYESIPVVSSTIGESGSDKQIKLHYEWLNKFDKIILNYDSDQAGQDAIHKVAKVLPKGKAYVMNLPMKDTNEMLMAGKEKQWIDCFFKAKQYTPNGIVASTDIQQRIIEEAKTPKIPLPPFMHKLQDMMAGGIPLGVIVNLGSASGTGKSTFVDELTYYWIFNSPHTVGVVTLESDGGQWGTKILSRHINQKIDLISDVDEKVNFLESPDIDNRAKDLWCKEDGTPRFYIIEERDGSLDSLKEQIMQLIIACDCKVIVLDPIQDALDGLPNEEQAVFLRWMKGLVKSHKVTFINISHVRKSGGQQKANSTGAELHEEDMQGSSAIFKSAACNLLFMRDKEAEDAIERNTTRMKASKIRWTGLTGIAGEYYYDNKTHTLWDKEEYFSLHGGEI